MRHRKRGRVLGRCPSHRKALLRNLASALFLTERDAEFEENAPKVKGRIITTLHKAKEVRPLVEKCITIARKANESAKAAEQFAPTDVKNTPAWKTWRESPQWQKWAQARAPYIAARRQVTRMLGDKQAVKILFDEVAPRFVGRTGGYTRILRLAKPRLGDSGTRAVLEFVGVRDRVERKSEKPTFGGDEGGESGGDE